MRIRMKLLVLIRKAESSCNVRGHKLMNTPLICPFHVSDSIFYCPLWAHCAYWSIHSLKEYHIAFDWCSFFYFSPLLQFDPLDKNSCGSAKGSTCTIAILEFDQWSIVICFWFSILWWRSILIRFFILIGAPVSILFFHLVPFLMHSKCG